MNNGLRFKSPFKYFAYSFILFTTLFTFISCENFLQGGDVKEEISKAIEYNNAPKYTIKFRVSDNKSGTITSPGYGDYEKKLTDTFKISFEPDSDYKFIKWKAIIGGISAGEKVSDYIEFEDAEKTETKVTFKKAASDITIRPVLAERLTYTFALKKGVQPRDSDIIFTFNKKLAPECFSDVVADDPILNPDDENSDPTEPETSSEEDNQTDPTDEEPSREESEPTASGKPYNSARSTDGSDTTESEKTDVATDSEDPEAISGITEEDDTNQTVENPQIIEDASTYISIQDLSEEDSNLYFDAPEVVTVVTDDEEEYSILKFRYISNEYIDVQDSTKTIFIKIPAEKIWYIYEGERVYLEDKIDESYTINSTTSNKTQLRFKSNRDEDENSIGHLKIDDKENDNEIHKYSVGDAVKISYKLAAGYWFYGWEYKVKNPDTAEERSVSLEELKALGINIIPEVDEDSDSNGYNKVTRLVQAQIKINGYTENIISINPVYYEYLKISDFNNKTDQTYERDRNIQFIFSQPVTGIDKIGIKVQGQDAKQYFKTADLSEDKKIVTIEAKREKAEDLIPLLADGTNTVTVTVPASDVYYEPESGVKVGLESDLTYSYKITSDTSNKVKVQFLDATEKGIYKVQNVKVSDEQLENYSVGTTIAVSYKLNEGYKFYGWLYKVNNTEYTNKDDLQQYGINVEYDEDGAANTGYNTNTRTAQMQVAINGYIATTLSIKPVYYEYLKITDFNNKADQSYERDRNIQFTFNQPITGADKIGIKVQGQDAKKYFNDAVLSEDKRSVTIAAKNESSGDLIPLLTDGTNTVTVTVPASDLYYEPESGVKVGLESDISYSYKINAQTNKKVNFKFIDFDEDEAKGNYKVQNNKVTNGQNSEYSIGSSFEITYKLTSGYYFYGWEYKAGDELSSKEELNELGIELIYDEDGDSNGFNSSTRTAQIEVIVNKATDKVISVRPVYYEYLKVTEFNNNKADQIYERDSNIEFTFNKNVSSNCSIGDIVKVTGLPAGKTVADYFSAMELSGNKLIIRAKNDGIEDLLPLLADGTNTITITLPENGFFYEVEGTNVHVGLSANETRTFHIGSTTSKKTKFKFALPQKENDSIGNLRIDGKNADEEEHSYSIGQTVSLRYQVPDGYFFYGWRFLNSDNEMIDSADLKLSTSEEGSTDNLKLLTITLENYMDKAVTVRPECFENLKVTDFRLNGVSYDENKYFERDSNIEFTFNKNVSSDCSIGDIVKVTGLPSGKTAADYFSAMEIIGNKLIIQAKNNGVEDLLPLLADGTNSVTLVLSKADFYYEDKTIDGITAEVHLQSDETRNYHIGSETSRKSTFKFITPQQDDETIGVLKFDGKNADDESHTYSIGQTVSLRYQVPANYFFNGWKFLNSSNQVIDADNLEITISDDGSTDKLKLLNVTINNYMEDVVTIKPECFENLRVTEFKLNDSSFNEINYYNRDSKIEIVFNKSIVSNCGISDLIKISGTSVADYFDAPVVEDNKLKITAKNNGVSTLIPLLADGTNTINVNLPLQKLFYEVESIDGITVNVGLASETSYTYKINSQTNNRVSVKFAKDSNTTTVGSLKIDGVARDTLEEDCNIGSKVELSYSLSKTERRDYTFNNWKITHLYTDESGVQHSDVANLSNLSNLNIRFIQGLVSDTNEGVVYGATLYFDNSVSGTLIIQPILTHIPDIKVVLDGEHGKFSPSKATYTYKLNESNHVEFEPDADYAFVRWQMINSKTKEELTLDNVSDSTTGNIYHKYRSITSNYLENEKFDFEFTTSLTGDAEIELKPIVAERPQIISYAPFTGNINKDTTIQVMFDYDMDPNSIYYTATELESLRETLNIASNSDTGSVGASINTQLLKDINHNRYYGYKKGSETVYKNISIVNSRSLTSSSGTVENLIDYFAAPVFENPRTLSVRVKRNASNSVDIKNYAQILVTIDKGFFYSTSEGNPVSMNSSKKWVYKVNNEIDNVAPGFETDPVFKIGDDELLPSTSVPGMGSVINFDEIPYYKKTGDQAFKLTFEASDNNGGSGIGGNFTIRLTKEYDENYQLLSSPVQREVGIEYDVIGDSVEFEGNCAELENQLDSGIYSISNVIIRDNCGNAESIDIGTSTEKIYICIDKTGPNIEPFEFEDTDSELTIIPTWDYNDFPDYSYTKFYYEYLDTNTGSYKYDTSYIKTVDKDGDPTLSNLRPGTKYRFNVYYYDLQGNSRNRYYYYGYTIPAHPASVSVERGSDGTSAVVTCVKPAQGNCTAIEISYRTTGSTNWATPVKLSMGSANSSSITISGLENGKEYEFKVRSYDSSSGKYSNEYTNINKIKTAPNAPGSISTDFNAYTNKGKVSWTAPAAGSNYTGYIVYCSTSSDYNSSSTISYQVTDNSLNYWFEDLVPGTYYYTKVVTYYGDNDNISQPQSRPTWTRPVAPSNLSCTSRTDTSITLSWTAPASGYWAGYSLEYKKSSDSSYSSSISLSRTATSYTITGLEAGINYDIRLRARYQSSTYSDAVSDTWQLCPNPVTVASPTKTSNTSFRINWTAPSGNFDGYNLYISTTEAGLSTVTPINLTKTSTEYTKTGCTSRGQYYFKLETYIGTYNSDSRLKTDSVVINSSLAFDPVQTLNYTSASTSGYTLTWSNPTMAFDGIEIYRGSTYLTTLSNTSTTYSQSGLAVNTQYNYRFVTYKGSGTSRQAAETTVSATTLSEAVSGLTATSKGTTSVILSWTNPTSSYSSLYVYNVTDSVTTYMSSTSVNTYTVTGLTPGKQYTFRVRTRNSANAACTSYTDRVVKTDLATATNISYTSAEQSVNLTWTKPAGTYDGIKIYKKLSSDSSYPSTPVATVDNSTTTVNLTSLAVAKTYNFKLETYKSSYTSQSTTTTAYTKTYAPGLSVQSQTPTSLTLRIVQGYDNGGTYVYYKKKSDSSYASVYTGNSNTGAYTYTISDLSPAETYVLYASSWYGTSSNSSACGTVSRQTSPNGVTNFTATKKSSSETQVSWTKPTGTYSKLYLYEATSSTGLSSAAAIDVTDKTSYTFTGHSSATQYFYKVVSYISDTAKTDSEVKSCITDINPVKVTNYYGENSSTIRMYWSLPDNYDGIRIYRGGSLIKTITSSQMSSYGSGTSYYYRDTNCTPNTLYTYTITSYKTVGSTEVTKEAPSFSARSMAGYVTNLTASAYSSTSVKLTWVNPTNTSYWVDTVIYAKKDGESDYKKVTSWNGKTTTTYYVNNLIPGTSYTFCVRTTDSAGKENYAYTTTSATKLATVSGVSCTALNKTQLSLSWSKPSGSYDGIKLSYRKSGSSSWTVWYSNASSITSTSITSLSACTAYDIKFETYKSGYTDAVYTVTGYTQTYAPGITVTAHTATSLTVKLTQNYYNGATRVHYKKHSASASDYRSVGVGSISGDYTYTITGLTPGVKYDLYASSWYGIDSNTAVSSTIYYVTDPGVPTNVYVTASEGDVIVHWDKPAGNENYHMVYYKKNSETSWSNSGWISGSATTSNKLTGLAANTKYDFKVISNYDYNEGDTNYGSSSNDNMVSADSSIVSFYTPPAPVTNMSLYSDDGMGTIIVKYKPSVSTNQIDVFVNGTIYDCYSYSSDPSYVTIKIPNYKRGSSYTVNIRAYHRNNTDTSHGYNAGENVFSKWADNTLSKSCTVNARTDGRFVINGKYIANGKLVNVTKQSVTITRNDSSQSSAFYGSGATTVTLSPYSIGAWEVLQDVYKEVMGNNPSSVTSGSNLPVNNVSWYAAIAFCNKLSVLQGLEPCYEISGYTDSSWKDFTYTSIPTSNNSRWNAAIYHFDRNGYHLPTEWQWEFAARGGSQSNSEWNYTYSGSNTAENVGWVSTNAASTIHSATTKSNNRLGLWDMTGNVGEWLTDWYYVRPNSTSYTNPYVQYNQPSTSTGPARYTGAGDRIIYKCTKYTNANGLKDWDYWYPYNVYNDIGFRLCRNVTYNE